MMRRGSAALLMVFSLVICYAQRIDFQQLKKEVAEAESDREKALALISLGNAYPPAYADSVFILADSIDVLQDTDNSLFVKNSATYLRSLAYYRAGKFSEAEKGFLSVVTYFREEEPPFFRSSLNFLGIIKIRTQQPDSAISIFQHLLETLDSTNTRRLAGTLGNLGRAYRAIGDYNRAIEYFEYCVSADSSNTFSILNSYLNIASIFGEMELYHKGIETLKKADISSIPDQPISVAYFNNLGTLFYQDQQPDSAILYLEKGLELAKKLKQYQLTIRNRLALVEIYLNHKEYIKAEKMLLEAKEASKRYPVPLLLIDLNRHFAEYHVATGSMDSALIYAEKVLNLAGRDAFSYNKKNTYELMARAHENLGNESKSAEYYKLYSQYKDSVQTSQKVKFSENAKAKYLLNEKEKELLAKESESTLLKSWQRTFMIIIGLLAALILVLYLLLRKSKSELSEETSRSKGLSREVEKNKREIIELKSKALLPVKEIISIKSDGHYLEFHLSSKDRPEIDRSRIKEILELLPSTFVQIHRSYVVNIVHIKVKYSDRVLLKDGKELPVSRTFKKALEKALQAN